jgi:hypothetical protein
MVVDADVIYRTAWDLAQSTSYQIMAQEVGNGADETASGYYVTLFNPSSSTTYVKTLSIGINTILSKLW